MIINAWEQIEGIKENVLNLITEKEGRQICIKLAMIPTNLDNELIQHSAD